MKELICKKCGRVLAEIADGFAVIKYRPRDASEKHTAEIFGYIRIRCMCGSSVQHRTRNKDRRAATAGVERGAA